MQPQKPTIQAPKVMAGPQIIGRGNNKIDIPSMHAILNNLKLQNAAASASHSHSSGGLKINHQSTNGSSGTNATSGSASSLSNLQGLMSQQVYARSTSRGKEHAHYSQASKLSAMLGKPSHMQQSFSVRNAINQTQINA